MFSILGLALVVVVACAEYAITPGSAYGLKDQPTQAAVNIRWLMPAITIAAALTSRAIRDLGRGGWILQLAAVLATLQAIHLDPPVSGTGVIAAAVGLAALAL